MAEPPDWIDTSRFRSEDADMSSSDDDSSSPSQLVIDAASAGIALLDTPTSDSPSYASDHHVFFPLATSPSQALRSLNASSPSQTNESSAAAAAAMATTTVTATNNTTEPAVQFLGVMNITIAEGMTEKVDSVCLYAYQWGSITLDIVATSAPDSASIPMRDMYDKVIPDIKRNVLSSRMSKIGVHSHALLEPYVVALRKLGLTASARSHYIKVADFVKLCQYYHRSPPDGLSCFSNVTSESPVNEVLRMAENDSVLFDAQRSDVVEVPYVSLRRDSVELAPGSNYSASPHQTLNFISADASSVDGRDLILPSGVHVTLLVREDVAYVSNQELCKVIPNINRNVMESIRNTYGIMVYPATKAEISLLKWIGVLGMKAGRALLYKITDVAKMFGYWHLPVSPVVKELCDGKIPTKKIDVTSSPPTPRQDPTKASPNTSSYSNASPYTPWKPPDSSGPMPSRSTPLGRASLDASGPQSSTLTPELFQKPVQFLSSIQQGLSSGVGRVGDRVFSSPFQQTPVQIHTSNMASLGARVDLLPSPKRRRTSNSEGASLDDQDLEYAQLKWGDHNLTLLCPPVGEPYLALPEFFNKILGHRSTLSVQRKEKLGVVTIPATSVQIHTLRVHGSLDAFAGGAKLVSFNSALKLAADSNIDVPRSVYEEYEKYCRKAAGSLQGAQAHGSQYQGAQAQLQGASGSLSVTSSVVPRLPQKMEEGSSPGEMTSQAFWDPKTTPSHPCVIDLGPSYHMNDGVICHVRWGDQLVVIYTSSRRINYVGLFQTYQMIFKQFVSRMNFKMRMRKLDVRSIRAPSAIRLKMIELNALPPHSPVCGLIKVNEMERLARSYGVTPPPVFYEVFMSRQSKAGKRLPHTPEGEGGMASSEGGKDGMVVSISRQLVHVDNPSHQTSSSIGTHNQYPPAQSHLPSSSTYPSTSSFKPSTLQTLAKKITQRHRKYSAGVSMVRVCPACHKVNPSLKKRCQYCSQFLIGRACASCGTLNHNRAKDCLKCHTAILPLQPGQPNGTPMTTLSALSSSADIHQGPSSAHYTSSYPDGDDVEQLQTDTLGEQMSPSSSPPSFATAPPIRSAVLKSLFPSDESAQVLTKTVFSGSLMASRQCMECGQLNSKMAKKCVQCRSPLQGRACPRCNRPNHNHSIECYKCGGPLPPTATRWVYSGMKGHRGSGHHGGSGSSRLVEGAETRAPIGCIRCFKLRMNNRLKCGRCGDVFHTKPLYTSEPDEGEDDMHSPIKDENSGHVNSFLLDFARNLACLGVEDQLTPIISTVEAECRRDVCGVEEEYNDVEEEYQGLLARKEEKMSVYKDLEAELGGLIRQLETQQCCLDKQTEQDRQAHMVLATYPARISTMQLKIASSDQLISVPLVKEESPHLC